MRRIIPKRFNTPAPSPDPFLKARQESLDAAVSLVRDRMSVTELAQVLGVSDDLVRDRLTKTPALVARLFWTGRGYQIPYAVGVDLVQKILNSKRILKRKVGIPIKELIENGKGDRWRKP